MQIFSHFFVSVLLATSALTATFDDSELDKLCDIYESQLKNFSGNTPAFEDMAAHVFTPYLLDCDPTSEVLAEAVNTGVNEFLDQEDLQDVNATLLPIKRLESIYEMHPQKFPNFPTFNDMLDRIKVKFLVLQRDPIDMYSAYKCSPQAFLQWLNLTPERMDGYLLATVLMHDNVDREYLQLLSPLVNEREKLFMYVADRDSAWEHFLSAVRNSNPTNDSMVSVNETLDLLICKRHAKEVVRRCRAFDSPVVKSYILVRAHMREMRCTRPKILLADFRDPIQYGSMDVVETPSGDGEDYLTNNSDDILYLLFAACAENDFEHALVVLPQVCKVMNAIVNSNRNASLRCVLRVSPTAAKRFITDTNMPVLDEARFKLGFPWKLSNYDDIIELFVHAMIVHSELWNIYDLYDEYIRGFPLLIDEDDVLDKTFERWSILINRALAFHPFASAYQCIKFVRRAVLVSRDSVRFFPNQNIPGILSVLEVLLDDELVAPKLSFSTETLLLIMKSLIIPEPLKLLGKILATKEKDAKFNQQLCFSALCQHHFGDDGLPMEVLEDIVKRASPMFTLDDISNKDFILAHLQGHFYEINMYNGKKNLEHIVYSILDGRVDVKQMSATILYACILFVRSLRSPPLFRNFAGLVLAAGNNGAFIRSALLSNGLE